jgi:hypothetical protein
MARAAFLLLTTALLTACGSTPSDPPDRDTSGTSGGEDVATVEIPLRVTTPVPVPQPAVAREELSDALQQLWTQVEETVSMRPPDGPAEASQEAVQEWADGPFTTWIRERRRSMAGALSTSEDVPEDPPHERAVASALMGYALEDFAADVRGSPVPDDIARDPELLGIYIESLREVLRPLAIEAVVSYAYCQRRLAGLGDESPWLPWRAYCVQRGREMIEVFELQPHEQAPPPVTAPPEDAPDDEEPTS